MDNNDAKRIIDAVILELTDWARWMRKDTNTRHLGYPSRSLGMESGYISSTFDEMCETADLERVMVINSLVNDLVPAQRGAVEYKYLRTSMRFPRNNYMELLLQAHFEVYIGMKKKGLYIF